MNGRRTARWWGMDWERGRFMRRDGLGVKESRQGAGALRGAAEGGGATHPWGGRRGAAVHGSERGGERNTTARRYWRMGVVIDYKSNKCKVKGYADHDHLFQRRRGAQVLWAIEWRDSSRYALRESRGSRRLRFRGRRQSSEEFI